MKKQIQDLGLELDDAKRSVNEINSQKSFDKLSNREDFSEKSDDDKKLVLQWSRNLIELAESQA